jgi:hypothetical protein
MAATRGRPRIHNRDVGLSNQKALELYATLKAAIEFCPNSDERNRNIRKRIRECDEATVEELHQYLGTKSNQSNLAMKRARSSIEKEYAQAKLTAEQKQFFKAMEDKAKDNAASLEGYDTFFKIVSKQLELHKEILALPAEQREILRSLHEKNEQEIIQFQKSVEYGASLSKFLKTRQQQCSADERTKDIIIITSLDEITFERENRLYEVPSSQQLNDNNFLEYDVDDANDDDGAVSDAATDVVA